jgi:hypothetical protein
MSEYCQELLPKTLVLEVLDAYTDHIASPNECVMIREIRAEVMRMSASPWSAFCNDDLRYLRDRMFLGGEFWQQIDAELARRKKEKK